MLARQDYYRLLIYAWAAGYVSVAEYLRDVPVSTDIVNKVSPAVHSYESATDWMTQNYIRHCEARKEAPEPRIVEAILQHYEAIAALIGGPIAVAQPVNMPDQTLEPG